MFLKKRRLELKRRREARPRKGVGVANDRTERGSVNIRNATVTNSDADMAIAVQDVARTSLGDRHDVRGASPKAFRVVRKRHADLQIGPRTKPEQSNASGPSAPQTYGQPFLERA